MCRSFSVYIFTEGLASITNARLKKFNYNTERIERNSKGSVIKFGPDNSIY